MLQSKKSSAGPGIDFISALPDALLHHVLSFLHAREAVQTCVLARRWRHLWISMPVVRITGRQDHHHKLRRFMDHLLLLRSRSNLDEFILDSAGSTRHDGDNVNLWIRHALLCHVRKLSVAYSLVPRNLHLVSKYLTELQLSGVSLAALSADFSSCVALKSLKMSCCDFSGEKISTSSLERLNLYKCYFISDTRTCISAPSLISLQLMNFEGRTPSFDDMPLLVTAAVTPDSGSEDCCKNNDPGYCKDASCYYCYGMDDGSAGSVLLKGFSAARNLELMAEPNMITQ